MKNNFHEINSFFYLTFFLNSNVEKKLKKSKINKIFQDIIFFYMSYLIRTEIGVREYDFVLEILKVVF